VADVIRAEGLTKFYGKVRGIVELDLAVEAGEVFGFLGPNGAGKTTTIRVLMDLLRPTSGRASVVGLDAQADSVEVHRRVGYLPGDLSLYGNLTGSELLEYFSHLRHRPDDSYTGELCERFDLDPSLEIRSYSSGNRQKVGLVQAFMHRPELLVLDEPTAALDPLVQQEFYRLVDETKSDGRTVFLSSHVIPEVERIADRVGIIREGELIVIEKVAALKARALRRIEIQFAEAVPSDLFTTVPGVLNVNIDDRAVTLTVEGSVDGVVKAAARYPVHNIVSHEADLEGIFLEMYRGVADAE
jgi:ABC-2 type transport system ATP-binding protein